MKKLVILAVAATLSSAAFAATETYVIDNTHTYPRFEYNHLGYSIQVSRFDKTSGKITLDRAAKTGSVDVVIDAKSVNTGYALFVAPPRKAAGVVPANHLLGMVALEMAGTGEPAQGQPFHGEAVVAVGAVEGVQRDEQQGQVQEGQARVGGEAQQGGLRAH